MLCYCVPAIFAETPAGSHISILSLDGTAPHQAAEADLFDWLAGVISDGGYLGIVLLMLAVRAVRSRVA